MPVCVVCAAWGQAPLCAECRSQLRSPRPVAIGGLQVASGLSHQAIARRLVHLLKYQAITAAADILSCYMATQVPATATALVPVPRAWVRRLRYGVDPARVLATRVGQITGLEVIPALGASPWWPSHAGSDRSSRTAPTFSLVRTAPKGSVLVDDVLTTGTTLLAARRATGIATALTATRADSPRFG